MLYKRTIYPLGNEDVSSRLIRRSARDPSWSKCTNRNRIIMNKTIVYERPETEVLIVRMESAMLTVSNPDVTEDNSDKDFFDD